VQTLPLSSCSIIYIYIYYPRTHTHTHTPLLVISFATTTTASILCIVICSIFGAESRESTYTNRFGNNLYIQGNTLAQTKQNFVRINIEKNREKQFWTRTVSKTTTSEMGRRAKKAPVRLCWLECIYIYIYIYICI
jgi:hypothetical protein